MKHNNGDAIVLLHHICMSILSFVLKIILSLILSHLLSLISDVIHRCKFPFYIEKHNFSHSSSELKT